MAGITGKNSLSIKKLDVAESKIPAIGFNKIRFMHKASAGDTEIVLSSLTTPPEATTNGFAQPNASILASIHLSQFRENFTLKSSLRGELHEFLAFRLVGANKITLLFEAEEGEIFTGLFDYGARTGNTIVDAQPLVVTGVLEAGDQDFNVGTPFQVGLYPSAQHGANMVIVDGQLMYRNTGNNPSGVGVEGDYYEVHSGSGLGQIIRFNTIDYISNRNVSVISIGSLVERPNGSQLALIEAVQGELDTHREILEELTETTISPGAPSSVDLKTFGDRVIGLEEPGSPGEPRLATSSTAGASTKNKIQKKFLTGNITTNTTVTDLGFSGLTIGKRYRISGVLRWRATATASMNPILNLSNSGTIGSFPIQMSTNTEVNAVSPNIVFTAAATTVTAVTSSMSNSSLDGNGTTAQTYLTLEELNDVEETTDFT